MYQEYLELEEVKSKLKNEFGREPSLVEWSEAVGLSCRALQSQLYSGKQSREKLIHANYRMVVHIAKKYHGCGLSLPDLLQVNTKWFLIALDLFQTPMTSSQASQLTVNQKAAKILFSF